MSQFIVIRTQIRPESGSGLSLELVKDPFVAKIAGELLPDVAAGELMSLVSEEQGDADALVDDLYNELAEGRAPQSARALCRNSPGCSPYRLRHGDRPA